MGRALSLPPGKPAQVFAGAIVNANAVAATLDAGRKDVTLLCAGTGGEVALEDLIGAGAVLSALAQRRDIILLSDRARIARWLFDAARDDLPAALADSVGGRNVIDAGLVPDIAFAAQLDQLDIVAAVDDPEADPPVLRARRTKPLEVSTIGAIADAFCSAALARLENPW